MLLKFESSVLEAFSKKATKANTADSTSFPFFIFISCSQALKSCVAEAGKSKHLVKIHDAEYRVEYTITAIVTSWTGSGRLVTEKVTVGKMI